MNERLEVASRIAAGIMADTKVCVNYKRDYDGIAAQSLLLADTLINMQGLDESSLRRLAHPGQSKTDWMA